ncbi:MAG: ABC transporter substrate-binding protein [Chloroflexi bacterium]|nr:ABC transporter substrate-binding protein [Chloroflexota bacterium]
MRSSRLAHRALTLVALTGLLLAACAPATAPAPAAPAARPPQAPAPAAPAAPAPTAAPAAPAAPARPAATPTPIFRPATPTPGSTTQQARRGGVLVTTHFVDPAHLDVIQHVSIEMHQVMGPAYSTLLQFDPDDNEKIIPDVAEKWQVSNDGLTYTLTLRKNVKFHDGKPLTSKDVKWSLDYYRGVHPNKGMNGRKLDHVYMVKDVQAPDDYTIVIKLKDPAFAFPHLLATESALDIAPEGYKDGDLRAKENGTGPFKMVRYQRGSSFEFERFKDFYIPGLPYLDGIKFLIIRDDSTRLAALRTGRVDLYSPVWDRLTPSQARVLKEQMGDRIVIGQNNRLEAPYVAFGTQPGSPFVDRRVRRAFFLAVNRDEANQILTEGKGLVGGLFPPGAGTPLDEVRKIPGYRLPHDQDVVEAKKLLAEAGYPDGKGLQFKYLTRAGWPTYVEPTVFMAAQMKKYLNVDMPVDARETTIFYDLRDNLKWETLTGIMVSSFNQFEGMGAYLGPANRHGYRNDRIMKMWAAAAAAVDPVERNKKVRDLELAMMEDAPVVATHWTPNIIAWSPKVKGYWPGVGLYGNMRFAKVWLAQ